MSLKLLFTVSAFVVCAVSIVVMTAELLGSSASSQATVSEEAMLMAGVETHR